MNQADLFTAGTLQAARSHPDRSPGDVSAVSSIDDARAARDAGIQQAVDHADAVTPKWSDTAYDFLVGYAYGAEGFTSEDVREAAYKSGAVDNPPSERAWGGVFMRAARKGVVQRAGYDTARDPKVHCNVVTRWRSLLWRGAA